MDPGGVTTGTDPTLLGFVLVLAVLVTLPIAGVAAVAYVRRRNTSYLLVTLALFALVARIGVAAGTVFGIVPDAVHHLAEHGLDVTIAALLVGAVVAARDIDQRPTGEQK